MEGFWCATGVDNSTREITLGKWGICQENCAKYGKFTRNEYIHIKVLFM